MRPTVFAIVSGGLFMLGCEAQDPVAPAPEPSTAPAPAAPVPEVAPPPSPEPAEVADAKAVISDPTFELRIDAAGTYVPGELARVDVALEPRGVYHINQEYPISIELSGDDGIALPKSKLGRTDAVKFDEKKALFEVPLTPSTKGAHRVQAKVRFAVCTDETCVPDQRTLALALAVE